MGRLARVCEFEQAWHRLERLLGKFGRASQATVVFKTPGEALRESPFLDMVWEAKIFYRDEFSGGSSMIWASGLRGWGPRGSGWEALGAGASNPTSKPVRCSKFDESYPGRGAYQGRQRTG